MPCARIAPVKRKILILALVVGVLAVPGAAKAQAGAMLNLRTVQSDQFPLITGFLDARDSTGAQITGLEAADLSVLEDGRTIPMGQIRLSNTGLNLYVAIAPSQAFAIRNSGGQSRYDLVQAQLIDWADTLADDDDLLLSLSVPQGVPSQQAPASEWRAAFEAYEPAVNVIASDLQSFSAALNLATQPAPQAGMGTAIWLISAVPPIDELTTLGEWQSTLVERGIRLFLWLVDTPARLESDEAQALQSLAVATGGQAFAFSQEEIFPDPGTYFDALSQAYYFQYESQANTSGSHSVQLQWQTEVGAVLSHAGSFSLEILPPNPIFVTPPSRIERLPHEDDPQLLAPFSQPLEILIEFPDDFERQVVRSTLLVNGQPVAENSAPPFNNFIWDLRPFDSSQELLLQVEVEDELGLAGRSMEHPLEISTQPPASFFQSLIARGAPALAFSVVLIAAGAVFLVLVLSGRIRPPALQTMQLPEDELMEDPLALLPLPQDEELLADPDQALPMPAPRALAYLQRLDGDGMVDQSQVLPVTSEEIHIGAQAEVNQIVLEDESVDAVHASLTRLDNGIFVLADQGSEAGTWLNYAPVSQQGSRMEEGDLVHIGRVAFRFSLLPTLAKQQ